MQVEVSLPVRHLTGSPFASHQDRGVFVFGVLVVAMLAVCLAVEAFYGMPQWLAALPFAASLVFCGMPHGAMDWHVHRRLFSARSLASAMLAFIPYTALCVLCVLVLFAAPVAYIAFFLLLTLVHFGRADARIRTGLASASISETVRGVSRAAAVVTLPFTFQPVSTGNAIAKVSALAGGPATLPTGLAATFGVLGAIGIGVWLLDAALMSRDEPPFARLLPLAILTTSAVLPPLFSVGLWFLLWHALRECIVLGGEPERPLHSVVRAHLRSFPLLLPTLVLALALGMIADAPAGILGVAIITLTLYAVFTPAHHLLQELAAARDRQFGTGAGYTVGAPGPTGMPSTNTHR